MHRPIRPSQEDAERFMSKVAFSILGSDCWTWKASVDVGGYGRFLLHGSSYVAHRIAYYLAHGPIPDDQAIDHLCRNRRCVNPEHLEAVTPTENVMRGVSFSVVNRAKSRCQHGHPYDETNTYIRPNGHRDCRRCIADRVARYKLRVAA